MKIWNQLLQFWKQYTCLLSEHKPVQTAIRYSVWVCNRTLAASKETENDSDTIP